MLKNLKKFDYFNTPIRLRMNGYDSHYTYLGFMFTLILLGLLIFISFYFGKEMIE